ncbi:MAG: heavy-metal-associated domain-containing protein [Hyphomonadaceae bacterium]
MTMLKTLFLAFLVVLSAPIVATAQDRSARNAPIAADVEVSVNGLVCDFCAQAIDRSFRRHPEVNAVRVDLTARLVSIDFRPNQNLDDGAIRDIVTRAGYTVTGIRRTAAAR